MAKNELKPSFFYGDDCNCGYTSISGKNVKTSLPVLIKLMESLPTKPKILTMALNLVRLDALTSNTIILSKDVADALEEAMTGDQDNG